MTRYLETGPVQKTYAIFADYHQFYLADQRSRPEAPEDYDDTDIERRLKAAPHIVVVMPARNMTVPVEVEILDAAPALAATADGTWDHVVEASLEVPSGGLDIRTVMQRVDRLTVPPGTYRVRASFGGLGKISADGLEGEDHYRVELWPAPAAPLRVLKVFDGSRAD